MRSGLTSKRVQTVLYKIPLIIVLPKTLFISLKKSFSTLIIGGLFALVGVKLKSMYEFNERVYVNDTAL